MTNESFECVDVQTSPACIFISNLILFICNVIKHETRGLEKMTLPQMFTTVHYHPRPKVLTWFLSADVLSLTLGTRVEWKVTSKKTA